MSSVKVLGINSSPRKYGNSYKLLRIALRAAEEEGAGVEVLHLYDYEIRPCKGCVSDRATKCKYPCIIDDDMKYLYDKVLSADALIISTPIYWFDVSGQLKNFIDRLTALENMILFDGRSWLEGKVAGVIVCGNDGGAVHVASTLLATLNDMGIHIPPWAMVYYVGKDDVLKVKDKLLDAANLGKIIVKAVKLLKGIKTWYDPSMLTRVESYWVREVLREIETTPKVPKSK
ncbi:MAG: NADPH-dependent FMN reductase [Thermofilum sp. ex4484_15]|nr:MAG: NADPH-dependent FMN reductase [Thermofilum sp. ex4484_15]